MNPQEPVVPEPDIPNAPGAPVSDPKTPEQPAEYDAQTGAKDDELDAYDEAEAESFPASDPPAASQPGVG
ncbi:MAG TPA: hypothetical protein VGC72_13180 [Candidatus Elarobacter sp.]|jgi:hypothetical protein